jgi:hypothetical protein
MCPIDEAVFEKRQNRCLLLYGDETVADALAMLKATAEAQAWWHLVVDLGESQFAAGRFEGLSRRLTAEGDALLEQPLAALLDNPLAPVTQVVEREQISTTQALDLARKNVNGVVVLDSGQFTGFLAPETTRGSGDLFGGGGLIQFLGKAEAIHQRGSASPRRLEAMLRARDRAPGVVNKPPQKPARRA